MPISGDLRLHGIVPAGGNAGGTVQRCDTPHSFAASWEYGRRWSWIEVTLTPGADCGTRFQLEHIAHVAQEFWDQFGPGAVGVGWDLGLLGLASHLAADGSGVSPQESAAWAASEDGKAYVTRSSEAWYEASVAAGTEEAAARAAADRTTAFYTGNPAA